MQKNGLMILKPDWLETFDLCDTAFVPADSIDQRVTGQIAVDSVPPLSVKALLFFLPTEIHVFSIRSNFYIKIIVLGMQLKN